MDGLFLRDRPGYEQARVGRVFNRRRPDRYPDAVLVAADAEAVADGVRLAAERGWQVAVRAGGHSWAAWSVRDGGLLIDLQDLHDIAYDESTAIVVAGPSVRGGLELAPFLASRGRAFPGGHCPGVGIGGFLLQGGQGWNSRSVGWACESVAAVDVVTASGELVRADANQNSDLYWAARGAGPGFPGIVTAFHLRTYPAYPVMWHDTWVFGLEDGETLLAWMHELLPKLDRRVEPVIAATRLPRVPLDPGVAHPGTVLLLHTTVMTSSPAEAAELLAAFDDGPLAGRKLGHVRGETTIAEENQAQEEQNPEGYRFAVDCTWTDAPASVLAGPLLRLWRELDTRQAFSIWYGWAPNRPLPDMAFSVEGNVYIATYAIYEDPVDDEKYRSWVHSRTAALPGTGVYLGDTDFTRRQDRFLSDANFARLQEIQARWDPNGRFASYLTADVAGLNRHG
ncbi:FAD-binding oxidoreductase [Actinoplanes sp. NPDC051513]|uniref:FAD-binding oxidoreductase n=1 Tax=Actinoplanes sp. NPDC051513 TaxID=3363908 RepID=UPI0037B4FAE2